MCVDSCQYHAATNGLDLASFMETVRVGRITTRCFPTHTKRRPSLAPPSPTTKKTAVKRSSIAHIQPHIISTMADTQCSLKRNAWRPLTFSFLPLLLSKQLRLASIYRRSDVESEYRCNAAKMIDYSACNPPHRRPHAIDRGSGASSPLQWLKMLDP